MKIVIHIIFGLFLIFFTGIDNYKSFTSKSKKILQQFSYRTINSTKISLHKIALMMQKIVLFVKKLFKKLIGFLKSIPSFFSRLKPKRIPFPKLPFFHSKHKGVIFERHPVKKVKAKRKKRISVFPLPFLVKVKYFLAGGVFSLIVIFLPLLFLLFLQDLPNPSNIARQEIPQTTKIYDRHGTLLYQIYANQNRTIVPLESIPKNLQLATIAIEDKDFYSHPGFDIAAMIRSGFRNASGKSLQGGSTITQQLIKSALLSPETSLSRKVKEVILAFWAERLYTKKQILYMYFNQIPYGGTAWGVEAAAQTYFGKHVKDLDLAECAFLAGVPQAPSSYSPYGNTPTVWKNRQKEVLSRMRELGYITQDQTKKALAEELRFETPQIPIHAPHFVMYVRDLLIRKYGIPAVERGGLTVITSLDLPLQEKAQKIVTEEVQSNVYLNLTNGAALVTNPKNGDVLAMIGSKDFQDPQGGNVNLTTSLRQPGSSIKVVTYAAGLAKGLTAASILDDSPVTYTAQGAPPYSPVNYDGMFHGKIPLRIALANSFNIPAVKVLDQVGVSAFFALGKQMGITTWGDPANYGLSVTLGSAEITMVDMATVYGTLANEGIQVRVNPLLKVSDSKGTILEEKSDEPLDGGERVVDQGITYILSDILADNGARTWEFGPNSPLQIPGHFVSVKTGTSDNKRDNWTFGYTNNYVVSVWVGNNDNSPMSQELASGITGAAPIWNKLMTLLIANSLDRKNPMPLNVVTKSCLGRTEYFIKGTENSVNCGPLPSPGTQFRQRR